MLNFLFGRAFWSTVIRTAVFLPMVGIVTFLLAPIFGAAEDVAAIKQTSALLLGVHLILSLIFGAWVGWGLAYWRFKERPIKRGWFTVFPVATGLFFGPLAFWSLLESLLAVESVDASEKTAAMIFGAVTMPAAAFLTSLFWRYAPTMTAMRRSEE